MSFHRKRIRACNLKKKSRIAFFISTGFYSEMSSTELHTAKFLMIYSKEREAKQSLVKSHPSS